MLPELCSFCTTPWWTSTSGPAPASRDLSFGAFVFFFDRIVMISRDQFPSLSFATRDSRVSALSSRIPSVRSHRTRLTIADCELRTMRTRREAIRPFAIWFNMIFHERSGESRIEFRDRGLSLSPSRLRRLVVGRWPLAVGCWSLVVDRRSLIVDRWSLRHASRVTLLYTQETRAVRMTSFRPPSFRGRGHRATCPRAKAIRCRLIAAAPNVLSSGHIYIRRSSLVAHRFGFGECKVHRSNGGFHFIVTRLFVSSRSWLLCNIDQTGFSDIGQTWNALRTHVPYVPSDFLMRFVWRYESFEAFDWQGNLFGLWSILAVKRQTTLTYILSDYNEKEERSV